VNTRWLGASWGGESAAGERLPGFLMMRLGPLTLALLGRAAEEGREEPGMREAAHASSDP
jgi:hypothetical protein